MQPEIQEKHIKVLLCQLSPTLKNKKANIERASSSLALYSSKDAIDIILFPEMSFVGYNFRDQADALPLAIKFSDQEGQQFKFATKLAQKLQCYVIFGYIQKQQKNGSVMLYNSAAVVDRQGKPILNYRKTHLYYNDKLWCEAGDGFKSLEIINSKGETFRAVIGICMDINEKEFSSGQYEWAEFARDKKAELLLFLTNWVDSQADSVEDSAVVAMYNYWLHRLRPLLSVPSQKLTREPVLFLAADRVGRQYSYQDKKEIQFFGSSCALYLNPLSLFHKLSKLEEGYLMVEGKLPRRKEATK